MQPTTTGIAAIRAQVRMLGRDSELFAHPLVVAMFMRPTNTAGAYGVANVKSTSPGQPCDTYDFQVTLLPRPYPGRVWKNSKILRALSALTPGTLPRSAIEARSISFKVPKWGNSARLREGPMPGI